MSRLERTITYFGFSRVLACDGRCEKAWGTMMRPCAQLDPDDEDFAWLADGELGEAPEDPGTYEGDHPKPSPDQKLQSKWCARQCERSTMVVPGEEIVLRDFSRRFYNKAPHTRDEPEIKDAPLDERIKAIVTDFAPRLNELTFDERLTILIPMIIAQVRTSPNSVREWGRVLSLMLDKEPDQVVILCSNLAAKVARKHGVMPPLERIVDVAQGLEAHVLAGLERGMRVSD